MGLYILLDLKMSDSIPLEESDHRVSLLWLNEPLMLQAALFVGPVYTIKTRTLGFQTWLFP